jgi:hypothetical protein
MVRGMLVSGPAPDQEAAVERAMRGQDWQDAGAGRRARTARLRLVGWSRDRRVVILRRRTARSLALTERDAHGQLRLGFVGIDASREIGQLYRDCADCENSFDG